MQIPRLRDSRTTGAVVAAAMYLVMASFAPRPAEPGPLPSPLARLKAGNDRFVRGQAVSVQGPGTRQGADAPSPPTAIVLSCAESRIPAEFIFNARAGDLFVVRSLGQVVDKAVVASVEYGVDALHAPLLLVMGHDACDVVRLAGTDRAAGSANLEFLTRAIRAGQHDISTDLADVRAAVLGNVEQVINDALAASPLLRQATSEGRLQVVGAYFDAATGVVSFSEPVAPPAGTSHRESPK
jgi:carbonic anhydrase